MSKSKSQHARQPLSRVTRNQPDAPRQQGKGPVKPAGQGKAPFQREEKRFGKPGDAPRGRSDERRENAPFQRDDSKRFGKPGDAPRGRSGEPRRENAPFQRDDSKRFGKPGDAPRGRSGEPRRENAPFQRDDSKRFGKPGDAPRGRSGEPRRENAPFQRDDSKRFGKPGETPRSRSGEPRRENAPFQRDDSKRFGKPGETPRSRSGEPRRENAPYHREDKRNDSGERRFERDPQERGFGEARDFGKGKKAAPVARAKKLALRDPSNTIQQRTKQLRETRVKIDEFEPVRLQKALANSGAGSRRDMEELIEAGQVFVNGKKATLGDKVGPRDKVLVQGHQVKLKWPDRLPRIIIYHKQEGEIVSRDDPEGRVSIFDRLPQAKSSRWVTVGRLDVNTSGLLIVTTSGELVNRMAHPSFEAEREYAVRVLGELTDEQKKALTSEVLLDDGPARFDRLMDQGGEGINHWYRVVIREGRNREVRRMFEGYGLTVSRLIRLRFGPIGLPARLKRGQFYELNELEVANVMKWAGLTVTGQVKPEKPAR
ncbi:pseudouridine synthase [Crenobacter cavernae]|uniref:Pseudouridine synthase n=1 Tax=Crenobacter cavernae TaxID=2290923 RepID=A0A345Y2P4_9NEIS|nr:pseudouridine synthase [Crenobacter cavernae]